MISSTYVASGLLALAVLMLFAGLWVVARGAGRISLLRSDLIVLSTQVEALDARITREVKTRAGLTRVAEGKDEKTLADEALAILNKDQHPLPFPARPKRIRRNF